MVTVDNAGRYLQAVGLISTEAAIDGDLDIISATRRNRNLQVTTRGSGNFLIKQPNDPQTIAVDTLRREALFYAFCQNEPAAAALRPLMPRLIRAYLDEALLILELLREAKPLWRYYDGFTGDEFPRQPAAAVGRALATVHRTFGAPELLAHPGLAFLEAQTPWALEIHRPNPEILTYMSSAQINLIRILQGQPEAVRALDELRAAWQPETVIHGDVKLDNFLIIPSPDEQAPVLYLVDWELVQRGDPAWDLGGAFHDFIYFWVLSMDHTAPLAEMAAGATHPLSALRPAIHALWSAYCEGMSLTGAAGSSLLHRTVRYSAARVIQTAYEMARHFPMIPPPSVLMLQIGVNLAREPERALAELYGLTEEGDPL
ncbi:MAG: phosphotransferase [Mycobacterium leprae]